MPADLSILNKSEKISLAEKHLSKYVLELKRHFGFSDSQIVKLLESSAKKIKKTSSSNILSVLLSNLFKKKTINSPFT